MAGTLNAAQITELLSQTKSRGDYDAVLKDFLSSGEAGIEVDLESGRLAGKRAKMVKVGFDNARKKSKDGKIVHEGGLDVQVIAVNGENQSDDHIYLINKALAGGGAAQTEEAAA